MDMLRGDLCCLVAGVGFAVNYLPVKQCDTGDGIFFCAAMSMGILFIGLLTGMFLSHTEGISIPAFEPLAAVGGALWMLGNLMCPQIIQMIGLGLGLTMWDLSNMVVGWLIGHFGLFGIKKDDIYEPTLNLIGLVLACMSLIFFSMSSVMKNPEPTKNLVTEKSVTTKAKDQSDQSFGCSSSKDEPDPERTPHAPQSAKPIQPNNEPEHSCMSEPELAHPRLRSFSRDLEAGDEVSQKITLHDEQAVAAEQTFLQLFLGSFMSIAAGVLFGTTFVLPVALKEGSLGGHHSPYIMDYVFSHFIGIFMTSSTALTIYVAIRQKKSYMPCNIIVPAIWSGMIWGVAQVAWFQANLDLGFSVAFPVIASLPGIIGLAIGVCCFKEVEGFSARVLAGLGLLLRIPGVVLIAVSA